MLQVKGCIGFGFVCSWGQVIIKLKGKVCESVGGWKKRF